ncbi:DUF202 domain-containing protein [Vibrio hannami]|uniref:DUF202 domain-containing protein n=1 Tax=Vibrio hannami TaxID=2717094 RepID=UPI00240F3965|nr:DUF202 domain-containing protein [Vibrio hannami]MDG3086449.1 DUF202 domain-containing protein [Vibrio hannami]
MSTVNGLQLERTVLAWLRTQLVLFSIGVVLVKVSITQDASLTYLCGATAMVVAIMCTLSHARMIKLFTSIIIMLIAVTYALNMLSDVFIGKLQ